jgi:uncharacterized coiled-coil DUF342 family protein
MIKNFFNSLFGVSDKLKTIREDMNQALQHVCDMKDNVAAMMKSVVKLTMTVQEHHDAINELYALQAEILRALNDKKNVVSTFDVKSSEHSNKPN